MKMKLFLKCLPISVLYAVHLVVAVDNRLNVSYFPPLKGYSGDPWKPIDEHCKAFLEVFSEATTNFSRCLFENSVPPKMCLNCADEYAHVTIAFFGLKDDQQKSPEGTTCSQQIFDSYETTYIDSIYSDLKMDVWDSSKCDYCLQFVISPGKEHSHLVDYNDNTKLFLKVFQEFRNCTENVNDENSQINSTVCDRCWRQYEKINSYYDKLFYHKSMEFCSDVESAVNDSVKWWRDLQGCRVPYYPQKYKNNLSVGIICSVVFFLCIVFYVSSFIIVKRKKRKLKRMHRIYDSQLIINSNEQLQHPAVENARLLNSGARPRRVISYSRLPPSGLG